ncbi:TPA: hypothetical protein L0V92_001779 [Escherichia coli]|nr:hypothetical protein [Escherichia coli]EJF8488190.1 hypothetical protein [Escherichia coli]HBM8613903.1 hypothetical protein [Escherichia coli]HBP3925522.1 hypothetical protein [Escherichia coli]HDX9217583.1 hypothetical protein [Escherichia coli]
MIKDLVASGHALADDMTGAPSVLVRCLATQLEVQLVRANALAAENAALKAAHPQPFGPEMMKALDAYEKYQDEVPETGMLNAFFILRDSIRVDTPATDAFLAEIERKAIRKFINSIEHILRDKLSPYDTEEMLEAMRIFLEEQGGEQK